MNVLKIIILISFPYLLHALSGKTCLVKKSRTITVKAYRKESRNRRYSTKCGFFNIKRCKRYRMYYVSVSYSRQQVAYYNDKRCCEGWAVDHTGTHCSIHFASTAVSVMPTSTFKTDAKTTSLTSNISHIPRNIPIARNTQALESGSIAAVVLGVVLSVVFIVIVTVVLTRRYLLGSMNVSSRPAPARYEDAQPVDHNEQYATVNTYQDGKNLRYEIMSIENLANESNDRRDENYYANMKP